MAWKVDRLLSEVFPGEEHIYSEYRNLSSRELAVVCAAVLDLALAELIALQLSDSSSEIHAEQKPKRVLDSGPEAKKEGKRSGSGFCGVTHY